MESQDIQAKFPEITGHSRNLKELVTELKTDIKVGLTSEY